MSSYYKNIANVYDSSREYPKEVLNQLLDFVLPNENCENISLIDIGAGTGLLSLPFAERIKKVIAIDPSEEMLKILRKKASLKNIGNIETRIATAENTESLPESFDIVLTSHVLHLVDTEKSKSEIKRILKPNGLHVECECGWPEHRKSVENIWLQAKGLKPRPMQSTVTSKSVPDLSISWVLKETVEQRIAAYEMRSHGSCWNLNDGEFKTAISKFRDAMLQKFGSGSAIISSECKFDIYLTSKYYI